MTQVYAVIEKYFHMKILMSLKLQSLGYDDNDWSWLHSICQWRSIHISRISVMIKFGFTLAYHAYLSVSEIACCAHVWFCIFKISSTGTGTIVFYQYIRWVIIHCVSTLSHDRFDMCHFGLTPCVRVSLWVRMYALKKPYFSMHPSLMHN